MANSYFIPGEQRAAKVNELFTAIAGRYDLINDLQSFGLHRYWKRRLVKLANVQPGARALDVCCGTGDLALALAHRGAQTIGLDFNERMLQIAKTRKSKVQSLRLEASPQSRVHSPQLNLTFIHGDAQALPFPDNSFDIVTIGYGLRNLVRWETGLDELQRVARKGARILALEFGTPENPLWRWLYFAYLRLLLPVLGRWFCGKPAAYDYILESLKHFPAQRGIEAKMQDLGLVKVRLINLIGGAMAINYAEK